ncbi:MarR family winged helix-turn-helix transcriptional regulator [Nocardia sp. NPDC003963]
MQILGDVERGGPCAPVELAARQGVRVQSLTSNLNALEAAALITREQDRHDRRRQLVAITQTGRALVAADRTQRDHWLASAMAGRLNELERGILDLAGPVLRKLAEIPLDEVDSDAGDAVEQPAPRRS